MHESDALGQVGPRRFHGRCRVVSLQGGDVTVKCRSSPGEGFEKDLRDIERLEHGLERLPRQRNSVGRHLVSCTRKLRGVFNVLIGADSDESVRTKAALGFCFKFKLKLETLTRVLNQRQIDRICHSVIIITISR